jgi:uncharacterized membrane protein
LSKIFFKSIGLSEFILRLPTLVSGLATLVIVPILLQKIINKPVCVIFSWLLAISPVHIFFSRFARPYSISTFLALVGILSAYIWKYEKKENMLYVYIICAIFGPYFHLTVFPTLIAPLILFSILEIKSKDYHSLYKSVKVFGLIILGLLLLLCIPLWCDFRSLMKPGTQIGDLSLDTLWGLFHLILGIKDSWLLLITLGIGLFIGVPAFYKENKTLFTYISFLTVCQVFSVILLHPFGIHGSWVFLRYSFILILFVLIIVAFGFKGVEEYIKLKNIKYKYYTLFIIYVLVCIFFMGPIRQLYNKPNQWMQLQMLTTLSSMGKRDNKKYLIINKPNFIVTDKNETSEFYYYLNSFSEKSLLIVEVPWALFDGSEILYRTYQTIHNQQVGLGYIDNKYFDNLFYDKNSRFKCYFNARNIEHMVEKKVNYVILHKKITAKTHKTPHTGKVQYDKNIEKYFTAKLGAPVFEDKYIIVFRVTE